MTSLDLKNVGKSFGGLQAISDVSFSIATGQITGLIGPNGAGKSTLVNLITGLLKLTSGTITLDGQDIGTAPPDAVVRLGVARTFQNIRLLTDGTVLENVMIGYHRRETASILAGLLALPSSRAETARMRNAAIEMLDQFEIGHLANATAGTLSYGHQRRVEMARAFATDPRIVLLDEPVAGMNEAESESLVRLFRKLAESGVGILLIEHDVKFVTQLCHHVHVLDSGRIIASGAPDYVLKHPDVVAAYLGADEFEGVA